MAEELGERTEQPTSKRMQEARERGQVAKSAELVAAVELLLLAIALLFVGGFGIAGLAIMLRRGLDASAPGLGAASMDAVPYATWLASEGARVLLPVLALVFAMAVIGNIAQVGWHLTSEPLVPKLANMNPLSGLKRTFGAKAWGKFAIQLAKLALVILICWPVLAGAWNEVASLPRLTGIEGMRQLGEIAWRLLLWLLPVMIVLGLIDFSFQRWQLNKQLRMTRQEVERERREMDGNPELKSRRLSMARSIAMQRIKSAVPKADVIVTNPTHFAVALKYDAKKMRAPRVVAKGADDLAWRIREVAIQSGVPVVERPPLARALYAAIEPGREIHPEHYEAVAEVLAFVYRLKGRAA